MRHSVFACAAAALLMGSLGCRDRKPETASPFALFNREDIRAGIQFKDMDAAAKRESIGQFVCKDLWAGGKRCQMMIDPGMLVATVNGKGRVVHLKVSTEPRMRGTQWDQRTQARVDFAKSEFSRMREAWTLVNTPDVTAWARGTAKFRWMDDQSRWSAGMWYGSLYTYIPETWRANMQRYQDTLAYLPDSVVTTDEFGLEEYLKLEPAGDRTKSQKGPPTDPLGRLDFDLRNVASAQAEYFEDHATYATSPDALIFLAGDGVHIELRDVTRAGWAATGTHDALPGVKCVIYGGAVASPPTTGAGVTPAPETVACDEH